MEVLEQDRLHPVQSSSTVFFIIIIVMIINHNKFIIVPLLVNIAALSTWHPLNSKCFTKETEHFLSQCTRGPSGAKEG